MAGKKPVTIYVQGSGAKVNVKTPGVKVLKESPK